MSATAADALRADELGALEPRLGLSEPRRTARDHEAVDPLGRVRGEPEARRAAEREAAVRHALELEPVEQVENVVPELLDGVRAGRDVRPTVAAEVVAQYAEPIRPRRDVCIPELERRPQRVGEHEHGSVVGPVEAVAEVQRAALASR